MKGRRDLRIWQESIFLVKDIYTLTSRFLEEEKFGLVTQMRRSAVNDIAVIDNRMRSIFHMLGGLMGKVKKKVAA